MAEVHGTWDDAFAGIPAALGSSIDQGNDVGACCTVTVDGAVVADVWGGVADEATGAPWERDTIINVFSTTKTMTALSALVLVDRGEVDLDAPVAKYWPEFAANGKEGVLVRHLMGHTAGLPGWDEPMTGDDLSDWEKCTSALARQAPWWEPGTAAGYHAVTQGFLVGEVVRRVTGQTLGTFFAKEVAGPLGADFHIGTGPEHDARVAPVIPCGPLESVGPPDGISARVLGNPRFSAGIANEIPFRRAELPAANGHGNARSVATVQTILACGGTVTTGGTPGSPGNGVTLLSEATCQRVFEMQAQGEDLVLGVPLAYGIGYGINSPEMPLSPNPRTCFWGGWGGSLVVVDLDARLCVAYVMNKMAEGTLGDTRGAALLFTAYQALASRAG